MQINLAVDISTLNEFGKLLPKKLAYSTQDGLRKTILHIQQAEFTHERSEFIIRKSAYFFGTSGQPGGAGGRITAWPSVSQGRAYAEISVTVSSLGGNRRLLLAGSRKERRASPSHRAPRR